MAKTFTTALAKSNLETARQSLVTAHSGKTVYKTTLTSYLTALPDDQNWKTVHQQLTSELKLSQVSLPIAKRWASIDLPSAMDWYLENLDATPSLQPSLPQHPEIDVLISLPSELKDLAVDWLSESQRSNSNTDSLISRYADQIGRFHRIDDSILRLAALPQDMGHREKMIASFIGYKSEGKAITLKQSPADLNALVDAANLPSDLQAKWKKVIAESHWDPDRYVYLR